MKKKVIMKNMSRRALLVVLLLMSICSFSQNSESEFARLSKQMFVDMNNRDYDAMLAMTHPKVFEFATKEQMKTVIKGLFEGSSEFSVDVPKTIPEFKTSKVYKGDNNLEYGIVVYDMKMKMTFHNQKFGTNEKEMMISMMKEKELDVTFISDNSMNILMNNRITVILKEDASDNKWVMANYDPYSPLFGKILSAEIIETVKKYKEGLSEK